MEYLNWLAIIIATMLAFALRYLWYRSMLFGNIWKKELQHSSEAIQPVNKFKTPGIAFFMMFVYSYMLAKIMIQTDFNSIADGLKMGFMIGLCFSAMSIGINYQFSKKSNALFFIDAGYMVASSTLMGMIIGWMGSQ